MNVLLINLGSDLIKIKPIVDKISSSEVSIELPNRSWLIYTEQSVSWWNCFLFEKIRGRVESIGNINSSYYICSCSVDNICGFFEKTISQKIKKLRGGLLSNEPNKPNVKNAFDRMEIV